MSWEALLNNANITLKPQSVKFINMNIFSKRGCMSREAWLKYSPETSEPTNHQYEVISKGNQCLERCS